MSATVPAMESLLEIRDNVAVARNLVVCLYMATQSPTLPRSAREALCEVSNAAREKLEDICSALDVTIKDAQTDSVPRKAPTA